eukprot:6020635-Amphidinium_carterae.1
MNTDESPPRSDVYLWDVVFKNYWDHPGKEYAGRPIVVIADSCLHFTKSSSSAKSIAGQLKHSYRGPFEVTTVPGGLAEDLAAKITEVGATPVRCLDDSMVHAKCCPLLLMWMLNELVDNNNKMGSRESLHNQAIVERG